MAQDGLTTDSAVSVDSEEEQEVQKLFQARESLSSTEFPLKPHSTDSPGPGRDNAAVLNAATPVKSKQRSRHLTDSAIGGGNALEMKEIGAVPLATLSSQPITQWGRLSATNIPAPPPEPTERNIVFVKTEGQPLGFSLCGGRGSKLGDVGVYIKNIKENALAAEDGRLKVSDEIIEINGQSLEGYSHKKAALMIKVSHALIIIIKNNCFVL